MPDSETESEKFEPKNLYHTGLKTDDHGNLIQVERRLDSESFESDSTLYLDEKEKIQKLVDKRVAVNESIKFRNPSITASLFNEIQPKREFTFRDCGKNLIAQMKEHHKKLERKKDKLNTEKGMEMSGVDGTVYDWNNWVYLDGVFGNSYTHTNWKENFFFRVKLANQEVPVKKRVPGIRHRPGLTKLVDTQGRMSRKIAGYFSIDYPDDEENEDGNGTKSTKFRVLKAKKHSLANESDPEQKAKIIPESELDNQVFKDVGEIVGLYADFCSRRRRLKKPLDLFELCKSLRLDILLERTKAAIITYWTFIGYMQLFLKYQNTLRSEELFFKVKGDQFMKILRQAGEYSYDQLMNDPVNGDFYRSIRSEPVMEIPVFLEHIYKDLYPAYYSEHWLVAHEDERQAYALTKFTDKDYRGCSKDLKAIDTIYPECIMRYQMIKETKSKEKNIPMYWGTRYRPGFRRISCWLKKILQKTPKKTQQRVFNNIEELMNFVKDANNCKHVRGNIYYHKDTRAEDYEKRDFYKDYHSDDCLSLHADRERPRVFRPDMFYDAAQNAFYQTFCKGQAGKAKETVTDPAIVFRLHMSKYLHSDRDRQVAEKRFNKPAVWKTQFCSAMEPYLAALKCGSPDSAALKKDYLYKYQGLLTPEEIVKLEQEYQPPTELRSGNLQDCIKSWIEKPSYLCVKTGKSLIDTPEESNEEDERETRSERGEDKWRESLNEKRESTFRMIANVTVKKSTKSIQDTKNYLEKLDVKLKGSDIVIICCSKDLHYVGKLESDDIMHLIEAAERYNEGRLDGCKWSVRKVVKEIIPLIMELIQLKKKKEENPDYNPVDEFLGISVESMINILVESESLNPPTFKNYHIRSDDQVSRYSRKKSPKQMNSWKQAEPSTIQDFRHNHACLERKEFGLQMKNNLYHLQGKCLLPDLIENKVRFYVLKIFGEELDDLVCRELVPGRLPHLLRYFNLMIQNRMKKRNEYKYWSTKKMGANLLNIIPRTFDMNHICESTPTNFSYSHLSEYKLTRVSEIPIDKVIKFSNLKRKILSRYKLTRATGKKCIEHSIKNTIKLAKRKALLRIANISIEKTKKIKDKIDKKRRKYLIKSLDEVERDLEKEKRKRKSLYMSIPPLSSNGEQPYLVKLNHAYDSMKKELEDFRKQNEYIYLYYMAMDLFKGETLKEKDYMIPCEDTVYPTLFFGKPPHGKGGQKLTLNFQAIRDEFENEKDDMITRFNNCCKKYKPCSVKHMNDKWHFKSIASTKKYSSAEKTQLKGDVARYNKKFGVLVSDKEKKIFALPRLYKFIEWTKYSDLIQRYFLKTYDVNKRKNAFVVQYGNFALKGSEKVIKKCLFCLRMFGIKKKYLEFALILYAKLQFKNTEEALYDELSEVREQFISLCERNEVLSQLNNLEEKIKQQNELLPDFVTWHEDDEDYHMKTYIGGYKKHKTKYESFFSGLKCKKNRVVNQEYKYHDLHDYKYYNFQIDHNYHKKNDYSSDEGDENENHYLDNLCSCGMAKETSTNKKTSFNSSEKEDVRIEYEIQEQLKDEQEDTKLGCSLFEAKNYSTTLKAIKITAFSDINKNENKKHQENEQTNSVETLSPETMIEIHQFFDREIYNFNKGHVLKFIDFLKETDEGKNPEFCLKSPKKETKEFDIPEALGQGITPGTEGRTVPPKITPKHVRNNSKRLVDKYMYTEFIKDIPCSDEKEAFVSNETISPLQLERAFHYCRQLHDT